jgi:hypothetical protein
MIHELILHLDHTILNANFFSYLIQSILICSLTMSLIAGILLLITRCLKDRQSAAGRCLLWWITGIGFLIPFKPHPAGAAAVIHERFNDATVLSDAISDRLRIGVYLRKEFFLLLLFMWMTGAVIYGARDAALNHFTFGQSFARFLVMLLLLKAFDIGFFDWFLLCRFRFFQYYYPEVAPVYDGRKYGFNIRSQLLKLFVIFPAVSALAAWVCALF